MKSLFKILFLQCFWFIVVFYGKEFPWLITGATALAVFFLSSTKSAAKTLFFSLFFLIAGFLHDSSLIWLGLIESSSYHYVYLTLWPVFLIYYGDIFNRLAALPVWLNVLLGGVGGSTTYIAAAKLGALTIADDRFWFFTAWVSLLWASFFPWSLMLFYNSKYWNDLLDRTILFSFDETGFIRHKNEFSEDLSKLQLNGKTALVTGGTSGIGEATTVFLRSRGADIHFTGRDEKRGQKIGSGFVKLDMSDWEEIKIYAQSAPEFDLIVLNAGSMPETYNENKAGVELQSSSQLVGHYLLIEELRRNGKIHKDARIVWVSSGGMYLKKLDLDQLFRTNSYDKVATYANVKRAQVTLVEEMAKMPEWQNVKVFCMHPGWVKTSGLTGALPGFTRFIGDRLRSPGSGADTILWLLMTSKELKNGAFYFDRKETTPYIHTSFIPDQDNRRRMLEMLKFYLSNK